MIFIFFKICSFQVECLRADTDRLFVSFVPPHKKVATKTLARWMSLLLAGGGVDTSKWRCHSVRAAGAANLRLRGFSLKEICAKANWSLGSGTYKLFYERYF